MKKLYFILIVFIAPILTQAQITWNFTTASPTTISPANITVSDLTWANNNAPVPVLNATSASSGYPGVSGGNNASAVSILGALNTATSTYFTFTLTPPAGTALSISQINFGSRSTSTGAANLDIRTSLDGFASAVTSDAGATSTANVSKWLLYSHPGLTLAGATDQAITVRIYGYNGTANGSAANWRIDDLSVTASTSGSAFPSVTNTPGNYSGLTALPNTPSSPSKTETVTGSSLTDNVTVSGGSGVEISPDNITFTNTFIMTPVGGAIAPTTIYLRLAANPTTGPVTGFVNLSVPGMILWSDTITGTITNSIAPDPLKTFSDTTISSSEIDLRATADAAGDNILVAFSTTSTFGTPSGALNPGDNIPGGGTVVYNGPATGFPFAHTSLSPLTKYFYSAWSADASGNYSATGVTANGTTNPAAANIVINQVYGGGGNSGAVYTNDFIELFNDGDTAVPLHGWSVQYASSAGTTWQTTALGSGIIPAHGFYLVQESQGSAGTTPLPKADTSGGISMAAVSGKVILCNTTAGQGGHVPAGVNVVDKVAYGTTSDILGGPGTGNAPTLTNTTSDVRKIDGVNTGNNAVDFGTATPLPRNSLYIVTPPVVTRFSPVSGFTGLAAGYIPSLVFSKPIVKISGNVTLLTNGVAGTPVDINDASIVLHSDTLLFNFALSPGNTYAIEMDATALQDAYGNAYAGLPTPTSWTFTTYNPAVASVLDTSLTYNFNICTGTALLPYGFTQYSVSGAQIWDCTAFGRDSTDLKDSLSAPYGVQINGFANGVNNINQDWLISPRIDLTGTAFPLLSFWSRNGFSGDPLTLKISTDYTGTGDPALANWTDLNGRFPSQGSDLWAKSSNINLSAYKQGSVYFAFVYKSSAQDGSRWTLDDIKLLNSATPPPASVTQDASDLQFGYTAFGSSTLDSLTVTGNDLVSDITLTTGTGNFLISTDKVNFANTATLLQASANNTPTTIYIRLTPSATNLQFFDTLAVSISDTTARVTMKGNSVDPASTLNIVNWNLNWFGIADSTLGPVNKSLQETNVAKILPTLHADLYALQEVVNTHVLDSIVATMPGYAYVINNYGSHSNTAEVNHYPLDQIQKLAFIYNTAKFSNIHTDSLLSLFGINMAADTATLYYNDWSSGRYPYMLTADVTLSDNKGGTILQTIRFINIHGKSNLSPVLTSYQRRADGARVLDSLIRNAYPNDNVVVLGDYNDDLNKTITAGITSGISSYSSFTIDSAQYYIFPTKPLSPAGQHSDVSFTSVIDNVIASRSMSQYYFPGSATVLSDVAGLVSGYGTTTTDHYPVFSQFSFAGVTPLPLTLLNFTAAKQDQQVKLSWSTAQEQNTSRFEVQRSATGSNYTVIGTVTAKGNSNTTSFYNLPDRQPLPGANYYRLNMLDLDGRSVYSNVVKVDFSAQQTIRINPNPAHGTVFISIPEATDAVSIQILDLNGRTMKQISPVSGTQNIPVDISELAKGIYTIKVIGSTGLTTQKLLVR